MDVDVVSERSKYYSDVRIFVLFLSIRTTLRYAPAPRVGALKSDDARLTSDVCRSRTSGLSREQRGL